tara:strand:+ start:14380 stop:15174 length:795 start_codon:yes stop_codon:yes gene_type:complete
MTTSTTPKTKKYKSRSSITKAPITKDELIDFCKIFFLNSLSCSLFFVFINNAWSSISLDEIKIQGNNNFNNEKILNASGLILPKPLLTIIPKQVEGNLIKTLSLKNASVRRQILPEKLIIEILEREPIAYAQRIGVKGIENGMIDKYAEWIPIQWTTKDRPEINFSVVGWNKNYRNLIVFILQQKQNLGSPLKKINLSSTGEITLETEYFHSIDLGANPEELSNQIQVLEHLSKTLPLSFTKKKRIKIDLRDLSKPELQTGSLN